MLLKRYKEFSTLETNPEWQKNLQATPDMELIRQQFDALNKYDPIEDKNAAATIEDSNYHGHFSRTRECLPFSWTSFKTSKINYNRKRRMKNLLATVTLSQAARIWLHM